MPPRKAPETEAERIARLGRDRERRRLSRQNETAREREARLDRGRKRERKRRENETVEERAARLDRDRACKQRKLQTEITSMSGASADGLRGHDHYSIVTEDCVQQAPRVRGKASDCLAHNGAALREFQEEDIQEHFCGGLTETCDFCHSTNFAAERSSDGNFTSCCHKGKVCLEPLTKYPDLLEELLCNRHDNSTNFKENIRSYNNAFAFASMGAQVDKVAGRGPYCYKIHGQIYHRTSALHPNNGESRKFAQIYILDPAAAVQQRMGMLENVGCLEPIMTELATLLHEINPYAHAYKMMKDFEREEIERAAAEGRPVKEINMWIHQDKRKDKRRYNAPASNEVAIVFRSDDGEPPFDRDICVHPRDDKMYNISFLSQHSDPMIYPLLFPSGDKGWIRDTKLLGNGKRQNLTHLQFYSYRIATRDEFNPILSAGKLFQQYVVDAYCKIEANRLNYHRQNQAKLRTDLYSGLMDHVNNLASNEGVKPGTICILPSSFQGSPRAQQQNFQDAMAIVRKYGKPDIFATFTCNPRWREIQENLRPWESAENRPDLVARVFKLKLKEFLHDILVKHVLGATVAHVYVIEFQKRGLPHCHMLFILRNEDKPRTSDMIDKIVCAEIPDIEVSPRLYEIVKRNMVHGPCGVWNPKSPCMNEKKECTKDYPKQFSSETRDNVNGYPVYRRRNDGKQMQVGKYTVDNRWIVPYNRYLSVKYNAHINVEICSSIKSVKYLFKYVYKGHDRANLKIQAQATDLRWDEPSMFLDSRYISAPEGIWRIRENKMHEQSHTIIRLAVHLPDQQKVVFREGAEIAALAKAIEKHTSLTAWFDLNNRDLSARQYLYQDIPYNYIFNSTKNPNIWSPRQRGKEHVISRMYSVSPSDTERFYLRLLLLHVRGARSFEDIKTVDGVLCKTFREAAVLRNLVRDDMEWDRCLTEATLFQFPAKLRELFGVICALCSPSDPLKLWESHKEAMIEDFLQHHSQSVSEQMALEKIQEILVLHSKTCFELGLPEPNLSGGFSEPEFDNEEELRLGRELESNLNDEQRYVFNRIMTAIEDQEATGRCFFLDGPGGSGKSYTYNALIRTLRGRKIQLRSVALTGIAAELLIDGRTAHSTFGVPLKLNENSVSSITARSFKGRALKESKLIIWDECTMASVHLLTLVDRLLRDLMNTPNTPFGGKVMLLGGHFCQTLPVVRRGDRTATIGACLKKSSLWRHFRRLELHRNMRADESEHEFAKWILKLGNGEVLNSDQLGEEYVEIPEQFLVPGDIVDEVFGKAITLDKVDSLSQRAILCPKNKDTIALNELVLTRLEGEPRTYLSVDEIKVSHDGDEVNYPVEFLNSLSPSGLPPHKLNLKVGAVVMLLRNLNAKKGLCNGTRLVVTKMCDHIIEARIITGNRSGEITFIPRIGLDTMEDTDLPFDLHRRQFPIRLAYAITINKAQGQSIDLVGIFLPEPVFAHGQLYVAFSRGKGYSKVRVKIMPGLNQGKLIPGSSKVFTQNIVYKEVLDLGDESQDDVENETVWDDMDPDEFDVDTAQLVDQHTDDEVIWDDIDLEGIDSECEEDEMHASPNQG